ncbi:MAG: HAMP domain-containing protein [Xanthomonadales bacterium]|nr:HAMP domain-containing protein [Xanthomonadales bacterium]
MMRRLFWRLFAAFWIATVSVLVAFAWLSTSRFENERIPGLGITRLQAAMDDQVGRTSRELRREGEDSTRQWLHAAASSGPLGVYVFTANGAELLGRTPSPAIRGAAEAALADPESARGNDDARLRARAIRTRDGRSYAIVAAMEGNFFTRLLSRRPGWFWTNIGVAMIVSALFALLLAWYVAAPLTRIRTSTRRFAGGDLDARVGRLRFGRSAEVVALAAEFDAMAARIKTLVESQRRLVRDVSHELRSPLARQRVALELARDGDAAEVAASLDRIEREADRLEAMLAQSLELSRLETTVHAAGDDIALDQVLEDVITNADYEGAPRGRKVVMAECERVHLGGSQAALHSAFENVIRNALAHTADGSTVAVRLRRAGNAAEVRVRDHGPGVRPSDLERIFEPFFRTDSARTLGRGGTGLGLAIARRAIERHGGRIEARNCEDGGLEVVIRLPFEGRDSGLGIRDQGGRG